jgi:hypothetical protein
MPSFGRLAWAGSRGSAIKTEFVSTYTEVSFAVMGAVVADYGN